MTQSNVSFLTRRRVLTLGAGVPFAIALGGCDALGDALKLLTGRLLSLDLRDISGGFVNMAMGLNVENPNPIALPELGLGLGLTLDQRSIARFGTASPFSLPKEGGTNLNLDVGINALNTVTTLLSLLGQSDIPYKISGQATTPQLGGLSLPLSASGTIDLG